MAVNLLFTDREARKVLVKLHDLSKTLDPEISTELRVKLKHIRTLDTTYNTEEVRKFHSTDLYQKFVVENEVRMEQIDALARAVWEPFTFHDQKRADLPKILNKLRAFRNRHAHGLLTPPNGGKEVRFFHEEVKSLSWKFADWAKFTHQCLVAIREIYPVNLILEFNDSDDVLDAAHQMKHDLDHHRADLQSTIDFITSPDEWSEYIDVRDQKDRIAIDRLTLLLDQEKSNFVVQICGEGGLGKTALMREFIRRNVVHGPPENLFERYLIISSKSSGQGNVDALPGGTTFGTTPPRYPRKGPMRYANDLTFREFQRIIAAYSGAESTDVEVIQEAIEKNNFLIVLDNFEDCSDEDRLQYVDLFEKLRSGCRSRIIITGRKEASADDLPTIRLKNLSSLSASELLFRRYMYLQKNHEAKGIWEFQKSIYEALSEVRHRDFIGNVNAFISQNPTDADSQLDPAVFRNRIGHPLVILRMAVEMGRPELPNISGWLTEMDPEQRVISIVVHIAKTDGFKEWEKELSKWVTSKAYDDIQGFNECVLILMRLLESTADLGELKDHVSRENGDVELVEDAVQRLLSHQILIRRRKDGRYEAAEQAKNNIKPMVDDSVHEASSPTKVADEIERLLDQILACIVDDGGSDGDALTNLLGMDTSLENRKSLTKRSYTLMDAILFHLTETTPHEAVMARSFAKASASLLSEADDSVGLRPILSNILFRGLMLSKADLQVLHEMTRGLATSDVRSMPQATQTLAVPYVLRVIEESLDLHPIYLGDMLSILAALGAHSFALQKVMAPAWGRILTHPNVKHGNLMSGVEADSRVLIFRMAQNDEEWTEKTALLLNEFQAEQEKENWEDVLNWPRYALPPHAPEADVSSILLPSGFIPGENGLSFDRVVDGHAVFQLIGEPILSAKESVPEIIKGSGWGEEQQDHFLKTVSEWFAAQIREQPTGFNAIKIPTFIHENFGRAKEIIPLASGGQHKTWRSWFENEILSRPEFDQYRVENLSPTVLNVNRKSQTKNPHYWLFDDISPSAPNLPQAKDIPRVINALEGSTEISLSSIGSTHITFRENYVKYLHAKGKKAALLTFDEHLVEMQAFVLERAETAGIDLEEIKRLLRRWVDNAKKHFAQRSNSTIETSTHPRLTKKQMMRSRLPNVNRRARGNTPSNPVLEEE